jgi:hypothetical protein
MDSTIFAQIRNEASDFFFKSIAPVPGYSFNQYDTIKRCHLYYNSKYEDPSTYLGRDKLFFNVVNPPCEVATKQLNVDTKNIKLWPLNPSSYWATHLLEKELKQWLKVSEMGKILNQIAVEAPVYGSVALEKTPDGAKVVDIRRLILDPSVDNIVDSRFVTTVHYMTPSELRATNWDNIDVVIERFATAQAADPFEDREGNLNQQDSTPYIKVYKRYGEVPKWWLDGGKSDEMVRSVFIVAGADEQEKNNEGKPIGEAGVILFKSKWKKEWPYRDFHYTKSKGRWLGVGVVEMLFDVQVRMNELKNQKRVSMELSSFHLFQTPDKQIVRNILTDLDNGDLIISPGGITPIATEERNLSAFKDEEQSYSQQAERLSFAYEALRGEAPPSSTPLGTTQIVTAQASSVFAFKRENLCLFLREFFNELVMPQILKDMTPEHIMRYIGSPNELMKLDMAIAEVNANDFIKEKYLSGNPVNQEDVDKYKQESIAQYKKLGGNRFIKIKKAFYSNTEYDFDYIIDNEQADPQVIVNNIQKVITDLASNPTILQDPRLKLLYFKFAEKLGINQSELDMADEQADNQAQLAQSQPGQPPQQAQPSQLPANQPVQ